jgi:hypothetical protein
MPHFKVYTVFVIALMGIMLFHEAARAQQEVETEKIERAKRKIGKPLPVFKGIESAWIFLNVGKRRGGYFSRSQVYYIIKKMFKSTRQLKFEFVKFHNLERPDRRVYGIAHWSYRNIRNGRLFQDKVYVTLRKEGARWVMTEIKTTS